MVSLPAKWARKQNIKKGDEINLEEQDNQLIIGSEKSISDNKTSVDVTGLDPMVKRTLGALYKKGYDEVDVQLSSAELEPAHEVIREEFIGFEIVHQGKNTITLKKISSIDRAQFDAMLRRIFLVINQMAEESLEAIQKNDYDWLKTIAYLDKDINKYADFCRRILNKYGHSDFKVSPPMYYIVEQLERVGDCYRDISKYVIKNKIQPSEQVIAHYVEINNFVRQFYEIFYKFDLKELSKFGGNRNKLKEHFDELFEKCQKKDMRILLYLHTILEDTFDMNGALMAVNL